MPTASVNSSAEGATPPPHLPPVEQQSVLNAAAETPESQLEEDGTSQQSSGKGEQSLPLESRGEVQFSNTQQESTKGTVQQSNGDAAPHSVNDLQEPGPSLKIPMKTIKLVRLDNLQFVDNIDIVVGIFSFYEWFVSNVCFLFFL